jgi:hypothetical protein
MGEENPLAGSDRSPDKDSETAAAHLAQCAGCVNLGGLGAWPPKEGGFRHPNSQELLFQTMPVARPAPSQTSAGATAR